MYRVGLYTLGCKVSSYETEAVGERFESLGFTVTPFEERNDVYVINTCTVTAESDAKSRKYIRRAVRNNPDAIVIVVGCYSQRSPDEVAAIDGVSVVLGTRDKLRAPGYARLLLSLREGESLDSVRERLAEPAYMNGRGQIIDVSSLDGADFEKMEITRAPRTRGYVKIQDGCECKCTYCAISAARGPVRSKDKDDVIREVESLYASGTREIVLTGIETGSYGTRDYDLADLIAELDSRHSCTRIRLGSMAPELIGEKFITRVGRLSILVPHFHVSMQSASDAVLRAMKRRYTSAMALDNIRRIREYMPRAMFTADLMVGFPGESEEDFLDTLRFVGEAGLLDAHVFAYSRREGTPAATYEGQIPEDVKRERSARLITEVRRVRDLTLDGVVERAEPLPVIFETLSGGRYKGHSDSYIEVSTCSPRDIRGEEILIVPEYHKDGIIYGKIANM